MEEQPVGVQQIWLLFQSPIQLLCGFRSVAAPLWSQYAPP